MSRWGKLCQNCDTYHSPSDKCRPLSFEDRELKRVMKRGLCKLPEDRILFCVGVAAGIKEGKRLALKLHTGRIRKAREQSLLSESSANTALSLILYGDWDWISHLKPGKSDL